MCASATRKHPITRPIPAPVSSDSRASFAKPYFPLSPYWAASGFELIASIFLFFMQFTIQKI
jgi:hypothetical protein